jgi:hypothetical protein
VSLVDSLHGRIARRVLLNYRVAPDVLARVLPAPFEPKLHRGHGIAGVCLIRLEALRPRFVPGWLGLASENAAHRVAVTWETADGPCDGVYIPRRDTGSRLNSLLGGRMFPGIQDRRRFVVEDGGGRIAVRVVRADDAEELAFEGHAASALPATSAFSSLAEASAFFRRGAIGYSATPRAGVFHGIELDSLSWEVAPLAIETARSSFFDDPRRFPPGSVQLDCALVMRDVPHRWVGHPDLDARSTCR